MSSTKQIFLLLVATLDMVICLRSLGIIICVGTDSPGQVKLVHNNHANGLMRGIFTNIENVNNNKCTSVRGIFTNYFQKIHARYFYRGILILPATFPSLKSELEACDRLNDFQSRKGSVSCRTL
jgi:hypothetical protein